jgi:uncharacterized Zn finger protein (UPF0148 family)
MRMDCPHPHWTEPTNQHVELLEYGDIVPGITCPECGGELVHTSNGAFCDECRLYVPVTGSAVVIGDWTDEDVP